MSGFTVSNWVAKPLAELFAAQAEGKLSTEQFQRVLVAQSESQAIKLKEAQANARKDVSLPAIEKNGRTRSQAGVKHNFSQWVVAFQRQAEIVALMQEALKSAGGKLTTREVESADFGDREKKVKRTVWYAGDAEVANSQEQADNVLAYLASL